MREQDVVSSARELSTAGCTLEQIKAAGYDARVVEAASYDSRAAAKGAGHTVQEMKEAGLAWWRCEMAVSRARR